MTPATTVDEETPLLPDQQQQKKPTPLPWAQFSILLVLQLAEPLTSQVIYPFLPQVRLWTHLYAQRELTKFVVDSRCGCHAWG